MAELDYRLIGGVRPVKVDVPPVSPLELIQVQRGMQGIRATELAMQQTRQQMARAPILARRESELHEAKMQQARRGAAQFAQQVDQANLKSTQDFFDRSAPVLEAVQSGDVPLERAKQLLTPLARTEGTRAIVKGLTPENVGEYLAGLPVSSQVLTQRLGAEQARRRLAKPDFGYGDKMDAELASMGFRAGDTPGSEAVAQAQANVTAREEASRARVARQTGLLGAQQQVTAAAKKEESARRRERARTLGQVQGEKARNFINRQTGETAPRTMRYQEAEDSPDIVQLSPQGRKQLDNIRSTVPVLSQIRKDIEMIYGPGGAFEGLGPGERFPAAVESFVKRVTQIDPKLTAAARRIKSNIDLLRRNFQGQVGTQTEQDALRGLAGMPQVGFVPDTQDVAYELLNTMTTAVNASMGTILDNPTFQDERLQELAIETPAPPGPSGVSQQDPAVQTLINRYSVP